MNENTHSKPTGETELEQTTYSHPKWGILRCAHPRHQTNDLNKVWFRLDDISYLTGQDDREISGNWSASFLTEINGNEYISGNPIMCIFTRPAEDGSLDSWVRQDVLFNLLYNRDSRPVKEPGPDCAIVISVQRLLALVGSTVDWLLDGVQEIEGSIREDDDYYLDPQSVREFGFDEAAIDIPLELALRVAQSRKSFGGMLATIPILEALVGDHSQDSLDDALDSCIGLLPNSRHQVDARRLHEFLGVKKFFIPWITSSICDLWMALGRDFFNHDWLAHPDPAGMRPEQEFSECFRPDAFVGVISVSTQFAKYLAMRESNRRGYQMGRYVLREDEKLNLEPQPFLMRQSRQD